MPANLTAQYLKAEEEYRRAATPEDELAALQHMLSELPKHKGTDKLQADLKQKISKAKKEVAGQKKGAGRRGHGVRIERQGAGTVVLLGGPNSGKTQLVCSLTGAHREVASYPFTTHEPTPAMMPWEDVTVQLIDTPPVTADYLEPYMQGVTRAADLVLLLADLASDDGIEQCQDVLDRLGQTKTRLARESYLDAGDVGLSFTRTFFVPNKIDAPDAGERLELLHELLPLDFPEYVISSQQRTGLEDLRGAIYASLDVVRIYTKLPTAKQPDYDRPFTIHRGGTLMEIAQQVHKDFAENLKFGRVWGSAVHDGTVVKGDYVLHDKDIVELHL